MPVRALSRLAFAVHAAVLTTGAAAADGSERTHWAFAAPIRGELPAVRDVRWPRNAIDRFVLARLESEGLRPSPPATRARWMRRVTLDLTGLPPTPEEVAAFLADPSPGAEERVVDRLLDSPRYGERMALVWLDASRYADTHGYLFDTARDMWRWRDWVIDAYNRGMTFDRFTIEQLAGDLVPTPTLAQRIATGFNRNHIINNEAGAIPLEYLVENIADRVDTTASVWMGLTMRCARCHEHKYDPISQEEYYQLYAFFDDLPERGLDGLNTNAVPSIPAPTREDSALLEQLDHRIAVAERVVASLRPRMRREQLEWERAFARPAEPVRKGLVAYWPLDGDTNGTSGAGPAARFQGAAAAFEQGLLGRAASLDGVRYLSAGDAGRFASDDAWTLSAWVYPTETKGRRTVFSRMLTADKGFRGYALQLVEGFPAIYLIHRFPDNLINVQAKTALELHRWQHVLATCDGSGKAAGVKLYVDGEEQKVSRLTDTLSGSIDNSDPLYVGKGHPAAMFKGRIDEARVYDRALSAEEIAKLPGLSIHSLLAIDVEKRSTEQAARIERYYLEHHAPPEWRDPHRAFVDLREQRAALERSLPSVMVMKQAEKPRETRMLVRGLYSRPGRKVEAGTPRFLPRMDDTSSRDRLGLARWLVSGEHPLTARVAVNRYWQMYFGTGLVRTIEDFGTRGESPSHPRLLDWLATEFVRSGWKVKAIQRLIVTSATYRQSSRAAPELLERDPENRLLARGPRFRLGAEVIRDQALAASGLLAGRIGGPSVRPYQPAGLWKEVAFDTSGVNLTAQVYQQDSGEKLYRRSMYTFWKRTAPPPTMLLFDAPNRERCVLRRSRTNTPLQALAVMNDPTFVETSRKLAERMLREGGRSPRERIRHGFELVIARRASPEEIELLTELLEEQVGRFRRQPTQAAALLKVGASSRDESLDAPELAAYATVASVILNLDETLTKS